MGKQCPNSQPRLSEEGLSKKCPAVAFKVIGNSNAFCSVCEEDFRIGLAISEEMKKLQAPGSWAAMLSEAINYS